MSRYLILRSQHMFTTARGKDVPILETVSHAISIPAGADHIAIAMGNDNSEADITYFLAPVPET